MMPATSAKIFPLWQYLCQPIGIPDSKLTVNPLKFWHQQKVHYIERCWVTPYITEDTPEERPY